MSRRRVMMILLLVCCLIVLSWAMAPRADDNQTEKLLDQAVQAAAKEKLEAALDTAQRALRADPDHQRAKYVIERLETIARCTEMLRIDPKAARLLDARGGEYFKLGLFDLSIADFDKAIALQPQREREHWMRGISYYYAGRFEDGRKQFEAYQTFDDNDVENAVWRFLCMAKDPKIGLEKARAEILRIRRDTRVPMMEVYDLYRGAAKPNDVLTAVLAGDPPPAELNARRFYAYLYLGLYCEATGDADAARDNLELAVQHKIGHYMYDVALVHARVLKVAAR